MKIDLGPYWDGVRLMKDTERHLVKAREHFEKGEFFLSHYWANRTGCAAIRAFLVSRGEVVKGEEEVGPLYEQLERKNTEFYHLRPKVALMGQYRVTLDHIVGTARTPLHDLINEEYMRSVLAATEEVQGALKERLGILEADVSR